MTYIRIGTLTEATIASLADRLIAMLAWAEVGNIAGVTMFQCVALIDESNVLTVISTD